MLYEVLSAFSLLAVCVAIHAAGLALFLRRVVARFSRMSLETWSVSWLLIRVAWGLVALHLVEILLWAVFYWWQGCLPDFETAAYFSGVSYTTIGYGDIVLPRNWWYLGPVEGLTGILMCGLSTGFFFVIVSKIFAAKQAASLTTNP